MSTMRLIKESSPVYMQGYSDGLKRALEIIHNEPELKMSWNVREVVAFLIFYPLMVVLPMSAARIIIQTTKESIARKVSDIRAGR